MMFTDQLMVSAAVVVERMWQGGPLREVSSAPRKAWFAHSRYGFAGRYVCDGCLQPAPGIYGPNRRGKWMCRRCWKRQRIELMKEEVYDEPAD